MRKIAILMDSLAKGGAERQALVFAKSAQKLGHEAEIIIVHDINHFEDYILENELKVTCVTPEKKPFHRLSRIPTLAAYLKKGQFNMVFCFKMHTILWGAVAAKRAGIDLIFGGARETRPEPPGKRFLFKQAAKLLRGWVVNSTVVQQYLISAFDIPSKDIFILQNGLEGQLFLSDKSVEEAKDFFGVKKKEKVVSIIANLREEKNHSMFFNMAKKLLQEHPTTKFLVAGSGSQEARKQYNKYCEEIGIAENCKFLGKVENVNDLLKATDVVALTSEREGLPNVLIEAGSSGVPCVSTQNGGASEIIIDGVTGYLVPIDNPSFMAKRVQKLLENQKTAVSMGEKASEIVSSKFSTQQLEEKIEALLDVV